MGNKPSQTETISILTRQQYFDMDEGKNDTLKETVKANIKQGYVYIVIPPNHTHHFTETVGDRLLVHLIKPDGKADITTLFDKPGIFNVGK